MAKKKRRSAEKPSADQGPVDLPLPDRRTMERMMRKFGAGLGRERRAQTALDRAQEVIDQAFEVTGGEQVRLARKALAICPDCADAYVLLAENAETAEDALALYEQGTAAGQRALGKEGFAEYAGHFWGFLETRPYMRARQGLAQCLWGAGRHEEAAGHYQEMLRLNPDDNQGLRYSLATLLLDLERDADLRHLLAQYAEDASGEWAYTKALLAFREGGESAQANKLLVQATKANQHVPAYLLGHKQLPHELPPYVTMGGEDEAVSYVVGNRRGWLNTPGAISWLRKTLKVPLPDEPRRRRPSWPQLKLSLLRLPQERGEVWQVDARPRQAAGEGKTGDNSRWTVVIAGRASHELLGLEVLDSQPKAVEVWDYLVDTMTRPPHGEPYRPAKIEVRRKAFQTAWSAKLKQLKVECVLTDTLDVIDLVHDQLPSAITEAASKEDGTAVESPEDLLALPQEPGEIWQAGVRLMPAWITGEGQPYRASVTVVVSRADDLVLAHQLTPERPPAERLWEAVLQAIRQPARGSPHRPGMIEVDAAEDHEALRTLLDRAGVECVARERLERLDFVFDDMASHLGGPGQFPALLDVPGLDLAQVGSFYAAAAEFYRRKPWQHVPGDTLIKVECDKYRSGPWYAVVMGQSGVQQGLAVYEDLPALQRLITGNAPEEESARGMSALSLMFSEAFEMPIRDLDAVEKHGWPVAGPEAYPLVMHINPGLAMRPPLAWELEILEGCLRSIPDFLKQNGASFDKTVPITSGKLELRLARVQGT
jgi:tetratricopeptide (TPR) repeat protein